MDPYEYSIPQFAARAYTFNLAREKRQGVQVGSEAASQLETSIRVYTCVCVCVCERAISHPRFDNALAGTDKQLRSRLRTCSDICLQTSRFDIAEGGVSSVLLIKRHLVRKHPAIDLLVYCGRVYTGSVEKIYSSDGSLTIRLRLIDFTFGNWRIFQNTIPRNSKFFCRK